MSGENQETVYFPAFFPTHLFSFNIFGLYPFPSFFLPPVPPPFFRNQGSSVNVVTSLRAGVRGKNRIVLGFEPFRA